mgnify:FL=1
MTQRADLSIQQIFEGKVVDMDDTELVYAVEIARAHVERAHMRLVRLEEEQRARQWRETRQESLL